MSEYEVGAEFKIKCTAEELAKAAHSGQMYGDVEYKYHLEAVVTQVLSSFGCQPYITDIAWLHDILEDTVFSVRDLMIYDVSPVVIEAVELLTKTPDVPYKKYIERLWVDRDTGLGLAWKVKVADTICNLVASVRTGDPVRVSRYSKQMGLLYKGYDV